jgi:hypothetical protein
MNVENYETNEGQQSLSHSTRLLREKFSLTANAFASGTAENATTELNAGLTDAAERFQLWAGSVGAAVDPQRKVSLEWRLRDAPEIKDRIHELQSDLIEALDDCVFLLIVSILISYVETVLDIATGQRQSRSRPADSIILDPESDSDQETSYVDIGAMNEAQDILGAAMECVRSLLQLSILIRKATPRNRWDRALQKPKTDRLDDQFDIRHVGDKFPKLNRPEYDWLKVRLGRAITQRRQFIRYSRDHKSQMSSWEDERQKQSPVPELTHHFALPSADEAPGTAGVVDAMTLRPPITEGSTKASTLQVAALDAIKIDEDDDEASAISSVVSSLDFIDGGEDILHLPTLSAVNHGRDEFECPLCFTIQNFRQQRRWK